MLKYLVCALVLCPASLVMAGPKPKSPAKPHATCRPLGSGTCKACKNCKYCNYCTLGGRCSVCAKEAKAKAKKR